MVRQYTNRGKMFARRKLRRSGGMKKRQYGGRKIKQPVQFFTRTTYELNKFSLAAGGAASGASINFNLNALTSASEFTNLYDQYQIKAVKVTLIPRATESSAGVAAQAIGNLWSVIDYDDISVPGAVTTLLQYQNLKRTRLTQIHSRYFKPMIATEVFATGIASGYAPKRNVWLDCNSGSVEHYGMKLWIDSSASGVNYDLQVKYYLAFKNVR